MTQREGEEREEGEKGKGEGGARENYQSNIDLKKDPFDSFVIIILIPWLRIEISFFVRDCVSTTDIF